MDSLFIVYNGTFRFLREFCMCVKGVCAHIFRFNSVRINIAFEIANNQGGGDTSNKIKI